MQVNRVKLGVASLLLMAACSGLPFFGKQSPSSPGRNAEDMDATAPPRTVMEIHDIRYDGWTLSGRILLSPGTGQLRLDKRLIPSIDVNILNVSECEHGSVTAIHADVFAPLNRSENLLVLNAGYWYGTTVRFWLFDEHFTGIGPECVEADILLLSFDARPVARQRIRAARPPPQTMDGGTQEEPQPSPDAGSP